MKKFVTRSILTGLVIVLLPVLSLAGSDMRRGDKGEGVREAQEWLIELGVVSIVLRKLLLNRLDCPTPDRVSVVKGAVHLSCP